MLVMSKHMVNLIDVNNMVLIDTILQQEFDGKNKICSLILWLSSILE